MTCIRDGVSRAHKYRAAQRLRSPRSRPSSGSCRCISRSPHPWIRAQGHPGPSAGLLLRRDLGKLRFHRIGPLLVLSLPGILPRGHEPYSRCRSPAPACRLLRRRRGKIRLSARAAQRCRRQPFPRPRRHHKGPLPGLPASSGEQQPPCPPNPVSGIQPPHHGHSLNRTASGLEKTSPCQPQHPSARWCGRVRSVSLDDDKASHVPDKYSVSPMVQSHPSPADAPSAPPTLGAGAGQLGDAPRAGSALGRPSSRSPHFGGYQLVGGGFRTTTADAT